MKSLSLIFILQIFAIGIVKSQSFTASDLVNLAVLPSGTIDKYMKKKGFELSCNEPEGDTVLARFIPKPKRNKTEGPPGKTVDVRFEPDTKYYTLDILSSKDNINSRKSLLRAGFYCADIDNISNETPKLFQKANITILATTGILDGVEHFCFILKQKKIPSEVNFAEDLLQFDSFQYLSSFFGRQNINNDLNYFAKNELKKCSVLFDGTGRKSVFVWDDSHNLDHLLFIIVSNKINTEGADKDSSLTRKTSWPFHNGLYTGMSIKELLKLNEMDFHIYGKNADLAFMVVPEQTGNIDFTKTAVILNCNYCNDNIMFNSDMVSGLEVAKSNLPMKVHDIIVYPNN